MRVIGVGTVERGVCFGTKLDSKRTRSSKSLTHTTEPVRPKVSETATRAKVTEEEEEERKLHREKQIAMWKRVAFLSTLISATKSPALTQATHGLKLMEPYTSEALCQTKVGISPKEKTPFITFVLGGPGSGKGTQCTKIVETFGLRHLSAGDLLRKEISSKSENGAMVLELIKQGKIVPSEVTVKLIQSAMESSESDRFLIDGFPRTEENRIAYERIIGAEPNIVLFFDCPEDEMVKRVLSRNEGRVDDNIDTIKKRLKVFNALSLPVVNYYSKKGKLYKINAVGTVDEIFEQVRPIFAAYEQVIK